MKEAESDTKAMNFRFYCYSNRQKSRLQNDTKSEEEEEEAYLSHEHTLSHKTRKLCYR